MTNFGLGTRGGRPAGNRQPGRGKGAGSGLEPRRVAAALVAGVLRDGRALSEQLEALEGKEAWRRLDDRDRALARMIALTVLRRLGELDRVLAKVYAKGLPAKSGSLREILLSAAAQILFLKVADHAAVDLAVRLARADTHARHFAALANAGLRRIAREGQALLAGPEAGRLNTPDGLWRVWSEAYGAEAAQAIAEAHLSEAALDLSVKSDAAAWAQRLGGRVVGAGTVRLAHRGRVEALAGYEEGAWWVQDAAARLPALLLGDMRGKRVIDLCAAPGGKTAQLAAAGARVVAVERVAERMRRLKQNLARLKLEAECVEADALDWRPREPADALLLDAPCSASGTLRRHPDAAWLKSAEDVASLAGLQQKLLDAALCMLKPGGFIVFSTCSLDPAEGEAQIGRLLAARNDVRRVPVRAGEIGGLAEAVSPEGDLRTLPCMIAAEEPALAGMDGFYAARLLLA